MKELLVNTKVRTVIICGECVKPHCVYSKKKLSATEQAKLTDVKNSWVYTCGSTLFPPSSMFHSTIVVCQNITCSSPMETYYFSTTMAHFPPVCYWCGAIEDALVKDDQYYELTRNYQTVYAICFFCKAEGKSPTVATHLMRRKDLGESKMTDRFNKD